ncbi:MAG: IPT/TIG domain-containing protein [Planctomycetes bacterium]|nr:IPT/TIG domain-containing protein [Planctomycetota bacterium]
MARKQLLIATPVLLLLFFAVAWAGFRPEGVPLLPLIGSSDDKSSNEIADKPLDDSPPRLDEDTPVGDLPEVTTEGDIPAGIDETERERIKQAREEARIEAERLAAEEAKSGPKPPAPPPVSPGSEGAPDNRTPEQKALDAERQRRIDALKAIKRPPNQSLGNVRPRSRRLKAEAGKKELGEISPKLLQDRRGLYAKYYAFNELPLSAIIDPTQPELDARTPDITRIDSQVYFESKEAWADLPFDKRNFMGVWTGYLVIKEDADYWLYLGADYTGVVTLDGESILFNDMRDYTEVSTVLTLTAGLHPIRIDYMEGENGSPVDPLAACNFMYVPEGQSKPIPVPPEMLMLPEELWSDSAPIITKLSRYEGEIGDEITIYGQNFGKEIPPDSDAEDGQAVDRSFLRVTFAGQQAEILQREDTKVVAKVPVGAQTGKLIVFLSEGDWVSAGSGLDQIKIPSDEIPSNSVEFTVSTQFGLFASWHNLAGWSNYDFVDDSMHKPDVVRLERAFMFETRDDIEHPFRDNPLACHWEGKLGIPAGWVSEGDIALVRFQTYGRLRVKLGDQMRETNAQTGGQFDLTTIDFEVRNHEEHFLPLSIDWTSESGAAGLKVVKMVKVGELTSTTIKLGEGDTVVKETTTIPSWEEVETLQAQLFFPPIVPPKPPVILSARPVFEEGQQPPLLPYTMNTTRPSIREGQVFEFDMEVFGNAEVLAAPVNITVDGVPLVYEVTQTETGNGGGMIRTCRATLPTGLGEGAIVARLTVVTSEPFYIDVQNKGLIAYLYDLPNPGGYGKMPDPEPLTCFEVRKMPWVNYENANQFNLPFPAETFAIEWFGALMIETEGDYRFTCRSDDGILVWLDDNLVLADDNLHYQREKTGDWVHLVPGVYNFRMQFFENNVHEVCVLEWDARTDKADDQSEFIQRGVIGKRHFTWDQHPALPQKVGTGKRADGSDPE